MFVFKLFMFTKLKFLISRKVNKIITAKYLKKNYLMKIYKKL